MSNINIDTGEIRLTINDDPKRVVVFNPSDALFAERFYNLLQTFGEEREILEAKYDEIEQNQEVDKNGLPANIKQKFDLVKETCQMIKEKIDYVFGENTSQIAFGDSVNLDVFAQFFEGITPFIEKTREKKVKKYIRE